MSLFISRRVIAASGGLALIGAFTLGALPAAASTQSNYIKALHRAAPSTKSISNKKMVALAKGGICPILGFSPISIEVEALEQSKDSTGGTDGYGFPKSQVPKILTVAVTYYCPKYKKDLAALKSVKKVSAAPTSTTQPPPPTTTEPTTPPLTQQQQNAVQDAESYLSTEPGFSQQGLIQQLSGPGGDGFSLADATAAVDSLTVNWNAQAVDDAQNYNSTVGGFSCSGMVQQLSGPGGDGFTVAQATYGATQAGDC